MLNTERHRAKYHNVERDPRITVLIREEKDPCRYAEVRGQVTQITDGDRARAQIDELAHKYLDNPYPPENIKSERVILRVTRSARHSSIRRAGSPTDSGCGPRVVRSGHTGLIGSLCTGPGLSRGRQAPVATPN